MRVGWKREFLHNLCEVFVDGDWIESKDQSRHGIRLVSRHSSNVG